MINYGSVNTHHPLNPSIHAGLEIFGKEVAMMNGLTLVCIAIVIFAFAYLFYGRWLVKTWGIEPDAKTPAYRFEDGRDFCAGFPVYGLCPSVFFNYGRRPCHGPDYCRYVWLGSCILMDYCRRHFLRRCPGLYGPLCFSPQRRQEHGQDH